MFAEFRSKPEYDAFTEPVTQAQSDMSRYRPRPAGPQPRIVPRSGTAPWPAEGAFDVSTRGLEGNVSSRERICDAQRVRGAEAELTSLRDALDKAETRAKQAEKEGRVSWENVPLPGTADAMVNLGYRSRGEASRRKSLELPQEVVSTGLPRRQRRARRQ
jgi:hypothetical protein